MEKLTLAKPQFNEQAITDVIGVLRSGNLVQGEQIQNFEQNLCDYTGAKFAIAMNSATSGLFASLIACGIKSGDEVIVPALSYIATANVVEMLGAIPVFCDIDDRGFNIDCDKLTDCLTSRTKAIIAVHEFGEPLNLTFLLRFCEDNNLKLIEDSACALGTKYNNQHVGIFGETGVFSFHPRKSITCGDGGAVITNNSKIAEKLRALRNHGMQRYGGNNFGFKMVGLNLRLTELQAALLNQQLPLLDCFLEAKRRHVLIYDQYLSAQLIKPNVKNQGHSWQSYHVLCKNNSIRDQLIKSLMSKNIFVSLGAQCIPSEPYYLKKYGYHDQDFPNAYRAYTCGLVLPIHENLTDNNITRIIKDINEVI